MNLMFKDHALLALYALIVGLVLIVVWTRPSDRWDITIYMFMAFISGFVVRSVVAK